MRTAPFSGERRIGAAWIGTREDDKDTGNFQFGGHIVFRELVQHEDGTLGTRFPPEMIPSAGPELPLAPTPLTTHVTCGRNYVSIEATEGLEVAVLPGLPENVRLTLKVYPQANAAQYGLLLRGTGQFSGGYYLRFLPYERRVELFDQALTCVSGLDQPFDLDIILKDDLIDVCIDQRRCLINRCPEQHGDKFFFFAHCTGVKFDNIAVSPLN
jgi:beta-fructofuranosidase